MSKIPDGEDEILNIKKIKPIPKNETPDQLGFQFE